MPARVWNTFGGRGRTGAVSGSHARGSRATWTLRTARWSAESVLMETPPYTSTPSNVCRECARADSSAPSSRTPEVPPEASTTDRCNDLAKVEAAHQARRRYSSSFFLITRSAAARKSSSLVPSRSATAARAKSAGGIPSRAASWRRRAAYAAGSSIASSIGVLYRRERCPTTTPSPARVAQGWHESPLPTASPGQWPAVGPDIPSSSIAKYAT
jgi:hypothetical protein